MIRFLPLWLLLAGLVGCRVPGPDSIVTLREVYQTERVAADNTDCPAVWHGEDGHTLLVATAKATHQLLVCDAADGRLLRRVGGPGTGDGQLARPNGLFVLGDLLFVVERDNHRVQAFHLPDFTPLGSFGAEHLVKPYGLWVEGDARAGRLFVTDNRDATADSLLAKRVHRFQWRVEDGRIRAEHAGSFGDTQGPGVLSVVESIHGDPVHDRLLLSEEDLRQSSLKIYGLDGRFRDEVAGQGRFRHQVEGIALWDTGNGEGWWIVADQHKRDNRFLVFNRRDLAYRGGFRGPRTSNTDGVWLTARPFGSFSRGAFFAVHNDGNVSAFDLGVIADSLGLVGR
jgi:3-phytase